MSNPIQAILSVEGVAGTTIYKVAANTKGFVVDVPCSVQSLLKDGRVLKLLLSASPGAAPIPLQWTVDKFLGPLEDGKPAQILQIFSNSDYFQIQFTQRCVLSETGYATWRIRISGYSHAQYSLTCQSTFANDGGFTPVEDFLDKFGQLRVLQLHSNQKDSASEFFFLDALKAGSIDARLLPDSNNELCYVATNWLKQTEKLPIGNGLELSSAGNGENIQLWQSCVFTVTPEHTRQLKMGIRNITSEDVLNSWTTHVARRYYNGLAMNHAFTLLPELTAEADQQTSWTAYIQITDNTSLDPGKRALSGLWTWLTAKSLPDWTWYRKDGVEEYPDPYQADGADRPANFIFSRLQSIRIANGDVSISANLGAFRRQDGRPIYLGDLKLTSPQLDATIGNTVAWKLHIEGSVQVDPGSPAVLDPTIKQKVEQVVRAGGFALHLLPPASNGGIVSTFTLDINADFGTTSPLPTASPVMPVVSCKLSQLPLWDCVPAAEDDLNGEQYAQLYVGTPGQNASGQTNSSVVDWLNEIYTNMQRDPSIVFRRPRMPKPGATLKPPADGQWYLQYAEQSSTTEKQFVSMQLLFTPVGTDDPSTLPDDSVLVFSRNPFSFADVHFHPLTSTQANTTKVADWNSVSNEWQILQLNSSPSYMVLPPQVLGEDNVTSDKSAPSGIRTDDHTLMAMGMPTVVTYAPDQTTNAVKLPWDLHRLTTDASLSVSRVDYEMLYGMVATTTADHMRLTEAASLYGDLLGEFPPLDLPAQTDRQYGVLLELRKRYLLARVHWSRIHREYRSRLGVFILQDSTIADPESFTDTAHTVAQLRLDYPDKNDLPDLSNGSGTKPAAQDYIQSSVLSHIFSDPTVQSPPGLPLKGGALNGVDVQGIFDGIVSNRSTGPGNAAVLNPRFSALGGFGTTRGTFNNGLSTLINTISMGRTVTYTVEQVGRIGCHWNRAKHVIVYERTVLPSRQFYSSQQQVAYRGIPLVRKVEEYVEFLQPDRIFSEESTAPQAAFASGFKCGEHKRISVDSAWGSVVPNQGWKVPLWNPAVAKATTSAPKTPKGQKKPAASQAPPLPDVYPKPQLYLEITSPEQALGSTDQQPKFLTADALLTHPEQIVFYTSFVETTPDTDSWKPVETVDFVSYPLIGPDAGIYESQNGKDADLNAVPLPEFPTPPGWEAVTFSIAPPAVGINVTAGVVSTRTPMAAQLTRVTVTRGPRPPATTVRTILANDASALSNYTAGAVPLATISQAFSAMRATIKAELAAPNTVETVTKLTAQVASLQQNAVEVQNSLNTVAVGLKQRIEQPFIDAATPLQTQINHDAILVQTILQQVYLDVTWTPASGRPVPIPAVANLMTHLRQTFQSTRSEVTQWQTRTTEEITGIVRIWTGEMDTLLANYAAQLGKPIGALSPLRRVVIALRDFRDLLHSIDIDIQTCLNTPPLNADIATAVQKVESSFNAAVSNLTAALTTLRQVPAAQKIDPSVVLLIFHTASLAGQFQSVVDQALQAAVGTAENSPARAATVKALTDLESDIQGIEKNVSDILGLFDESILDLLRQVPAVAALYDTSLTPEKLKAAAEAICDKPEILIQSLQANCVAYLAQIASMTVSALTQLGQKIAAWIIAQTSPIAGQLGPLIAPFRDLAAAIGNLDVKQNFAALQTDLDNLAGQYRGSVQQAGQYVDQYVRQPVMDAYQALTPEATSALRLLRAFGAPPQVPHLDIQPPVVGYLYDGVAAKVPITPILARANQAGQILNALGVHLPTVSLADSLIPATLKNFKLTDVLPNFAGLRLPGLFSGIKLPDIDNRNIKMTHGWEPQTRRAWLQADVSIPFTNRMVVFNAGFASFVLTNSTFTAQSRIQNIGTNIQQSTSGSITGTWNIEIGDSNALISFANTTLAFDEHGKFQFLFKPEHLTLSDALKAITALIQTFSDPKSGFTYGITPTGVKCAFALPVPDTAALTSGFTGLKFSTSLALDFRSDFTITLAIGVSSKDRPFNFAIFILGGCGYLTAGVVYNISKGKFDPPMLEMAIGCSASLAIALGPISGGVYAQFAIEARNNGGGFSTGAFFQITGHVSICGILSVDLVFRLEASYGNGVMVASGHFSISVSLFMFSFSVSRDVSMQMGSGGQRSARLNAPPLGSNAPRNLVAVLERPGEIVPGMADAFFSAGAPAGTLAHRYLQILL